MGSIGIDASSKIHNSRPSIRNATSHRVGLVHPFCIRGFIAPLRVLLYRLPYWGHAYPPLCRPEPPGTGAGAGALPERRRRGAIPRRLFPDREHAWPVHRPGVRLIGNKLFFRRKGELLWGKSPTVTPKTTPDEQPRQPLLRLRSGKKK